MDWCHDEWVEIDGLASEAVADLTPRRRTPAGDELVLRVSETATLWPQLPYPKNHGALLVRHLFKALSFDEYRLFHWQMDHKLIQGLLIERFCPGHVPPMRGLARELAGCTQADARRRMIALRESGLLVKATRGEASREKRQVDQFSNALDAISSPAPAQGIGAASDERFVLQEHLRIREEYRVHSLEDRVMPELTFRRHAPARTTYGERAAANAFVQTLLAGLPGALVRDTLYGWDVAIDARDRWFVIEANPSGCYPGMKRGFHCSGFFQAPPWSAPMLGLLLDVVAEQYGVQVRIELDAPALKEETVAYWWAAHCQGFARLRRARRADRDDDRLVSEQMDDGLSTEQNIFRWALLDCQDSTGMALGGAADRRDSRGSVETEEMSALAADVARREEAYPQRPIHRLFEQQAELRARAPAVISDTGDLSYGELNARANQLAHHLRGLGVGPERRVAVFTHRDLDMVVAFLAVMKAGAAYVPLDPAYPTERIKFMIEDARAMVVLTEHSLYERVPSSAKTTICLDSDAGAYAQAPATNLERSDVLEHLAYVIYTSGSTGRPKAVAITHASLANILCDLKSTLGVAAADGWLALSTVSFDIAATELFLPLISGAPLWLANADETGDPVLIMRRLGRSDANTLQATPSTWKLLVDAGWRGGPDFRALSIGEMLPPALAHELVTRAGAVWNLYGPTETTIYSSIGRITPSEARVSVGTAAANTSLFVLDGEMRLVPRGETGELFIGGLGVARGYLHRPALTAERFVPDPFAARPGARLYRTGDLARMVDGRLECLGRIDHQVKVNGVRVELGEVEQVLMEHAQVRDAVAVVRDDHGRQRLVAYVVYRAHATVTASDLQAFLLTRLPRAMVPSVFVQIENVPRTPNQKVDRRALPAPHIQAQSERTDEFSPPRTATEEAVLQIWRAVFGTEAIQADDIFLDLGGDSLRAIQCVNRVSECFDVTLPIITPFVQAPTVRTMARLIDECLCAEAAG